MLKRRITDLKFTQLKIIFYANEIFQHLLEFNNKFKMRLKLQKNQKVIKNDNDQLIVKYYPKNKNKQPIIQKQLSNCPSCKRNNWLKF